MLDGFSHFATSWITNKAKQNGIFIVETIKKKSCIQLCYLRQSCVRSPRVWTWRPWGPGSNPSMVPSIKHWPSDSCRKRTTPWIFPTPAIMATAEPWSVTKKNNECVHAASSFTSSVLTSRMCLDVTAVHLHFVYYLVSISVAHTSMISYELKRDSKTVSGSNMMVQKL